MSQFKLLKEVITFLNQADTSYMLTGSIVSSFQGEPRSTHDIDMMIQLDKEKLIYYCSRFHLQLTTLIKIWF